MKQMKKKLEDYFKQPLWLILLTIIIVILVHILKHC
jgi:hypothetical protein